MVKSGQSDKAVQLMSLHSLPKPLLSDLAAKQLVSA